MYFFPRVEMRRAPRYWFVTPNVKVQPAPKAIDCNTMLCIILIPDQWVDMFLGTRKQCHCHLRLSCQPHCWHRSHPTPSHSLQGTQSLTPILLSKKPPHLLFAPTGFWHFVPNDVSEPYALHLTHIADGERSLLIS